MVKIKSFSVGNGDMFYIEHVTDNLTIIDCCYEDEEQGIENFQKIESIAKKKGVTRFISTHPDEDHIRGLVLLDNMIKIRNFYVVKNEAIKKDESTDNFKRYCELRDDVKKAFYVYSGCSRKWLNQNSGSSDKEQRGASGISFLWPVRNDPDFIQALENTKKGFDFNNISPIFTYSLNEGATVMWMGDMESTFLNKIKNNIDWPKVDILFAPHHGRKSGHISADVLQKLQPKIIVIGEGPSDELDYYSGYNTIKQNSAGDIIFIADTGIVDVYVQNFDYPYSIDMLHNRKLNYLSDGKYLGSFSV